MDVMIDLSLQPCYHIYNKGKLLFEISAMVKGMPAVRGNILGEPLRSHLPESGNENASDLNSTPPSAMRFQEKLAEFNNVSAECGIFSEEVEAFLRANGDDEEFVAMARGLQARARYRLRPKGKSKGK